jgi:beta-glucosidase
MYDIFSLPEFCFPEEFLWGSSTAAHQIEGDNKNSQFWHMEQNLPKEKQSGKACNSYELYKDDIELIASLGHQVYRFSIEWSRIEPEEGQWNLDAVTHYRDLLKRLKEKGIKAFVTLVHGTVPYWFFKKNEGFKSYDNLKYFERYVEYIVPIISDYVDGWNVWNEAISSAPGEEVTNFNMIKAHAKGYHIIKQYSKAPVSSSHAFVQRFPYKFNDEFDNVMAKLIDFKSHGFLLHAIRTGELVMPYMDAEYIPEVKEAMDFWSVNIYTRGLVDSRKANLKAERFPWKKLSMIEEDFYLDEMYPECIGAMLERLKDRPVYITENGCSCDDDRFRIIYISLYLSAINEAIKRGVDVRGYIYWSLMDNFEWGSFLPRFGLVNVDFETFKRTPKPSADFYREIIENNGLSQKTIRKYIKEIPSLKI